MIDTKKLYDRTKKHTLLLVEDYQPLRDEMAEVLGDLFKSVITASNGQEALRIYEEAKEKQEHAFGLIISDIQMPVMNGVEFSRAVRQIDEKQKIMVLSAYTDKEYLIELINIGISRFVTKPIEHNELLQVLARVCKEVDEGNAPDKKQVALSLDSTHTWDKEKLSLTGEKGEIALSRHELLLLQLMAEKCNVLCTNEDICRFFTDNNIDLHEENIRNLVFKLRKKLPKDLIQSIYGMGYRFTPQNI